MVLLRVQTILPGVYHFVIANFVDSLGDWGTSKRRQENESFANPYYATVPLIFVLLDRKKCGKSEQIEVDTIVARDRGHFRAISGPERPSPEPGHLTPRSTLTSTIRHAPKHDSIRAGHRSVATIVAIVSRDEYVVIQDGVKVDQQPVTGCST